MRALIILILLIFQTDNERLLSPDGNYQIIKSGQSLGDSNTELKYHIISTRAKDTLFTTTSVVHDFLPPIFWWTSDSEKLIYEKKNELNSATPSIHVYDFQTDSVIFSTDGIINTRQHQKEFYFDNSRQCIIYFKREGSNYKLMQLNLNTLDTYKLLDFEHYDVYETPQIASFNKETGKIEVRAKNRSYEFKNYLAEIK